MFTEEQRLEIFKRLVSYNNNVIDNIYNSSMINKLGFISSEEKREEFYVTKEAKRFVTTGSQTIHNFIGQTFLHNTSDKETILKFFDLKSKGEDLKDYLSSADLFKFFTYQNSLISVVKDKVGKPDEPTSIEELILTNLTNVEVDKFFQTKTVLADEASKSTEQFDKISFTDVQDAIVEEISSINLSQTEGTSYFPPQEVINNLNLGEYSYDLHRAQYEFLLSKVPYQYLKPNTENADSAVGSENLDSVSVEMSEN